MYDLWGMPEVSSIPDSEALEIATCLQQVEEDMKSLLSTPLDGPLEHAREFAIGDTRVSTVVGRFSHLYNDRKESGHADYSLDETHDDGLMSNDTIEPPEIGSRPISPRPATDGQDENEYNICGRSTARSCSLCGLDRFCSRITGACPRGTSRNAAVAR